MKGRKSKSAKQISKANQQSKSAKQISKAKIPAKTTKVPPFSA
jgi:hypothetical protein